ncbi:MULTISPECIES: hypothetical protein [unclassified Asticcacaulis]|nr:MULTISPECIES: hypothetical protein [unclassified Asticcacaulis]MDV6329819.1 hypothetical protein [Asticcacaulis sp. 201]
MQNQNKILNYPVRPDLRVISARAARTVKTTLGFSPRELRRLVADMID